MFGLLIVIAAVTIGAVAAVILLVAWAIRREETYCTLVDQAPGRTTHFVRRLLGLHARGIASPWADQDSDDLPAGWPGPRGPRPIRWDTMAGV
jgi:hypothetical protein